MNFDAISRAANENTDPDPSERDFGELMANALRVCLDDLLANRGPMTDDQRKAMFAKIGGGSSPRAARWYDKDVLKAAGSGFLEGANNAAEKGLAKLSFGLTDKVGFTDSTRPELQWSGYDAADQNAELARDALITAMGVKAGTVAWNAWKAKQAAAAVAATAGKPTLEQAQKIVAELRAAYRHVEADALIKRMGDAWPKYTGHISTHEENLAALRQNPFQAWTDVYGNRASIQSNKGKTNMINSTKPLLFLSNAVRVAFTPDEVIRNWGKGPLTDAQRRAIFAKSGGRGTNSARPTSKLNHPTNYKWDAPGRQGVPLDISQYTKQPDGSYRLTTAPKDYKSIKKTAPTAPTSPATHTRSTSAPIDTNRPGDGSGGYEYRAQQEQIRQRDAALETREEKKLLLLRAMQIQKSLVDSKKYKTPEYNAVTQLLKDLMANRSISDAQRRAIFAKKKQGVAGAPYNGNPREQSDGAGSYLKEPGAMTTWDPKTGKWSVPPQLPKLGGDYKLPYIPPTTPYIPPTTKPNPTNPTPGGMPTVGDNANTGDGTYFNEKTGRRELRTDATPEQRSAFAKGETPKQPTAPSPTPPQQGNSVQPVKTVQSREYQRICWYSAHSARQEPRRQTGTEIAT